MVDGPRIFAIELHAPQFLLYVDCFHYNVYKGVWETSPFYAANFNAPCISLVVGEEKLDELSFQVTSVNPL